MSADAISRFESEYLEFHRISKHRRSEVLVVLREMEAAGNLLSDPAQALRDLQFRRLERGNVPATVGRLRGMVRPFYEWAWSAKIITAEQLMEVRQVRGPRGCRPQYVPRPYTRDEIKQLWQDFDRDFRIPYTPAQADYWLDRWQRGMSPYMRIKPIAARAQTRAIIGLCLCGGLRLTEARQIPIRNLHYENAYLVVNGAAKNPDAVPRQRAVPWVTDELRTWVQEWLDLRECFNVEHDNPWLSLWGTAGYWLPLHRLRFEATMARLGRGWEFHRLRHTAATEMLRVGYPLETVQRILGHATLQQTLVYAQLLPDDIVRVAARSTLEMSAALLPDNG